MDDPFGKLAVLNQFEKLLSYEDPLICNVWILATGFWNDAGVWVDGDVWIDGPSGGPPLNSTTTLSAGANPTTAGQNTIFTATVIPTSPVPTGTVQFFDGAASLGTVSLNGLGKASFTFATLVLGSHSITAAYGGDVNYNPSTSSALIEIVLLPQYQIASRGKPWRRIVR